LPSVSDLLNTIDTTYRNSYSQSQKIQWMNETQRQIFQSVKHEAPPHTFVTISNISQYYLPADCDPKNIKSVVIQRGMYPQYDYDNPSFDELQFVSIDSNRYIDRTGHWYSVVENSKLFLNPLPETNTEGLVVYVYYNKKPAALTLNAVPDLEESFQELLALGCLERIARARGEYDDKNVFANDFQALLREYQKQYREPYPEYSTPKDMLPNRRGHSLVNNRGRRRVYPDGLIPY
jgi:hypothetical protein